MRSRKKKTLWLKVKKGNLLHLRPGLLRWGPLHLNNSLPWDFLCGRGPAPDNILSLHGLSEQLQDNETDAHMWLGGSHLMILYFEPRLLYLAFYSSQCTGIQFLVSLPLSPSRKLTVLEIYVEKV